MKDKKIHLRIIETPTKIKPIKIFCDGSSNGFDSAYCVILKARWIKGDGRIKNERIITEVFDKKYNVLEIEFMAFLRALEELLKLPYEKATIFTDSIQVISVISRSREAPKFLEKSMEEFYKLEEDLRDENKKVTYSWISRETNLAGQYLEKRLMKLKRCYK